MFRLEKVFQNDDSGFIHFVVFIKTISLFLIIYLATILHKNTIYDLFTFEIFKNSIFFQYTILITIFYFFLSFLFKDRRYVRTNFLSFIKEDILILLISNFIIFSIYLTLNFTFIIGKEFIIINT